MFGGRPGLLVTVWEPGLGAVAVGSPDAFGMSTLPPDPATMAAVDRLQHEHASRVAPEGAELARTLALDAEAHAVPDDVDIADTVLEIARERDAAVVVVASHGISGLRSRVLGSVARKLIEHCDRPVPVIIVRPSEPGEIETSSAPTDARPPQPW